MDSQITDIISNILKISDEYSYVYDKNQRIGGSKTFKAFYTKIKEEILKNLNLCVEEDAVSKIWHSVRTKFVRLNKKLCDHKKTMSKSDQAFYQQFIFLEDHISHKGETVVKWNDRHPATENLTDEDHTNLLDALGFDIYMKNCNIETDNVNCLEEVPVVNLLDKYECKIVDINECEDFSFIIDEDESEVLPSISKQKEDQDQISFQKDVSDAQKDTHEVLLNSFVTDVSLSYNQKQVPPLTKIQSSSQKPVAVPGVTSFNPVDTDVTYSHDQKHLPPQIKIQPSSQNTGSVPNAPNEILRSCAEVTEPLSQVNNLSDEVIVNLETEERKSKKHKKLEQSYVQGKYANEGFHKELRSKRISEIIQVLNTAILEQKPNSQRAALRKILKSIANYLKTLNSEL